METDGFDELKALSEVPSVATACGPVTGVLRRLLPGYAFLEVPDGFFLAYPTGTALAELRVLYVTHVDEIGGWVLMLEGDGRFGAWLIGNRPEAFAGTPLQAFRYDSVDASAAIPCVGEVTEKQLASFPERGGDEARLLLRGDGLEPFTMFWTFREELRVEGDRSPARRWTRGSPSTARSPRPGAWAGATWASSSATPRSAAVAPPRRHPSSAGARCRRWRSS
jgi:hypothetical protein